MPAQWQSRAFSLERFERLWQETGCQDVIAGLARKRGHHFAVERAVFLTVLHRLMRGGSDLAADRWREDYRIAGSEDLGRTRLFADRREPA